MKVFLRYEDNDNPSLFKTLKITLPKSWKNGPTSLLLRQFVESYNGSSLGESHRLVENDLHLAVRKPSDEMDSGTTSPPTTMQLPSDAISLDVIPDRSDVYVMHGPSRTIAEFPPMELDQTKDEEQDSAEKIDTADEESVRRKLVCCKHFGCKKRFPEEGPYPTDCVFHRLPPVFHETAKYWACCPQKKAYDWDDFESIPGCQRGTCTAVKEEGQKSFLGGTDLREQAGESAVKLKSIDDFNRAQAAGGTEAAPVLDRLKVVMEELGIEKELFDQVVNGMKDDLVKTCPKKDGHQDHHDHPHHRDDTELLDAVAKELGNKLKVAMKAIAVERLRL